MDSVVLMAEMFSLPTDNMINILYSILVEVRMKIYGWVSFIRYQLNEPINTVEPGNISSVHVII